MNAETYGVTAQRVAKGSKFVVVVTFPDGRQETHGGARAERATAVVVSQYEATAGLYIRKSSLELHVVGLRSDAYRAAVEANGLTKPAAPRRSRYDLNPAPRPVALRSAAVPVMG